MTSTTQSAATGTEHGNTVADPSAVPPVDLRVVSAGAEPHDVAAVTAVVSGALAELAAELGMENGPQISAWQRSQRGVRTTLRPGPGAWRSFSG